MSAGSMHGNNIIRMQDALAPYLLESLSEGLGNCLCNTTTLCKSLRQSRCLGVRALEKKKVTKSACWVFTGVDAVKPNLCAEA